MQAYCLVSNDAGSVDKDKYSGEPKCKRQRCVGVGVFGCMRDQAAEEGVSMKSIMEPCTHELASWIFLYGRIIWICRICFATHDGKRLHGCGCNDGIINICNECIDEGRDTYGPIIQSNMFSVANGLPSAVELLFARIYNDEYFNKLSPSGQEIAARIATRFARVEQKRMSKRAGKGLTK